MDTWRQWAAGKKENTTEKPEDAHAVFVPPREVEPHPSGCGNQRGVDVRPSSLIGFNGVGKYPIVPEITGYYR